MLAPRAPTAPRHQPHARFLHRPEPKRCYATGDQRFVLVRGGKPVAELSPLPMATRLGDPPALLGSLPRLDEPDASSLAEDMESARAELEVRESEDRWES